MELHKLRPAKGSVRARKRVARGQGSGSGGTAGRGHKGDGSRSGAKEKRNFEGGQMPLQMRLPKRGFKNINRVEYVAINLARLQAMSEKFNVKKIDLDWMISNGVVGKRDKVKILAHGELNAALTVSAHACSEAAKQAIEQKGGSLNLV
ncbi:MAG: 50S ribosomal protein L15 [Saprospirales bacterium]|jgi:large subunit ribosomal protein L15|nr:50S ribosomal protein L15 [Saprospirales bacterium]MBK6905049.1 50S ribosomal protein L15 [Saprospirales bacterium]MBK7335289.1 50S ribosomal protein L15 [Saprospirales bacterium]